MTVLAAKFILLGGAATAPPHDNTRSIEVRGSAGLVPRPRLQALCPNTGRQTVARRVRSSDPDAAPGQPAIALLGGAGASGLACQRPTAHAMISTDA